MKTINPFLPTIGNPVTIPTQLTRAGGTLYLVNQSNANYLINFQNGYTATLLAQHARPYTLNTPINSAVVSVQSLAIAPPLPNPQIWGEAFQPGEDISHLFMGPLTNDIIGLGQPAITGAGNLDNASIFVPNLPGKTFYLLGFDLTLDKAATPASGLFTITNINGSEELFYWLVQSNQEVFLEKQFRNPLQAMADPSPLTFTFPNLPASIGFNYYGWYQ